MALSKSAREKDRIQTYPPQGLRLTWGKLRAVARPLATLFILLLLPEPDAGGIAPPFLITDYPAVPVIYDPSRGGVNCDDDCSTVATGPLTDEMYFTSGACPSELLGATIHFPTIDETLHCVDTGPAIRLRWSPYFNRMVVYFDFMWDADAPPYWTGWLIEEWSVTWTT